MAVRHGPDELQVKEQQLEGWEEKLAQRAQALAESARALVQRRAAVAPLVNQLKAQGAVVAPQLQELLGADPLLASPHIAAAVQQAEEARRTAVESRMRAAQAWEEDLARQANALNAVMQGLAQAQQQLQAELDQRAARARPVEPPVSLGAPKAKPPPQPPRAAAAAPPAGGVDGRVHNRAKLRVQVDFESDHNFFTGFSADISEGGLFVATVNIQPLGSPVEVAFALPTGEQVVARGVVRWIREASDRDTTVQAGMGIQFDTLSEDARDAVHSFIHQREPMFYTD